MQSPYVLLGLIAVATGFGLYAMGKDSNPPPDNIRTLRRIYWIPVFILSALMFAIANPAEASGAACIVLFAAAIAAIRWTNFFVIPFTGGRTLGPEGKKAYMNTRSAEQLVEQSRQAADGDNTTARRAERSQHRRWLSRDRRT